MEQVVRGRGVTQTVSFTRPRVSARCEMDRAEHLREETKDVWKGRARVRVGKDPAADLQGRASKGS